MQWLDLRDGYLDYVQNEQGKYEFIITQFTGNSSVLMSLGFSERDKNVYFAPMTMIVGAGLRNLEGSVSVDYENRKVPQNVYVENNAQDGDRDEFNDKDIPSIRSGKKDEIEAVVEASSSVKKISLKSALKDFEDDEEYVSLSDKFKSSQYEAPNQEILIADIPVSEDLNTKIQTEQEKVEESAEQEVKDQPVFSVQEQEEITSEQSSWVELENKQVDLQEWLEMFDVGLTDNFEDNEREKNDEIRKKYFKYLPKEWKQLNLYQSLRSIGSDCCESLVPKILNGGELNDNEKLILYGISDDSHLVFISNLFNHYLTKVKNGEIEISDEEYERIKNYSEEFQYKNVNTDTQFFTPHEVVTAVWDKIIDAGFTGGKILEPSAGTGNFLSFCPEEIYQNSEFICVEKNEMLSKVLKLLHPNEKIINSGFEKVDLANGSVDLVIGNVPFSKEKVFDSKYDDMNISSLHNYFIIKSLDALKVGGIGVFVTSRYTLDALSSRDREEMAKRGKLLGAVRLSKGTFNRTSVCADILIFQKTAEPDLEQEFIRTDRITAEEVIDIPLVKNIDVKCDLSNIAEYCVVNKFYQTHAYYCGDSYRLVSDSRFDNKTAYLIPVLSSEPLQGALKRNLDYIDVKFDIHEKSELSKTVLNDEKIKNYGMFLINAEGQAYINDEQKQLVVKQDMVKAYIELRDGLLNNIREDGEYDIRALYENFKKSYGTLKKNAKILKDDPYFMSVLELDNPETAILKASLKLTEPEHIEDVAEAVIYSMSKYAEINLDVICEKTGKTKEEIEQEFVDLDIAYFTEHGWIVKNHYLSGDIYKKMDQCLSLPENHQERNMKALIGVKPQLIPLSDIRLDLGTVWIPDKEKKIESFLKKKCLNCSGVYVEYTELTDNWYVEASNLGYYSNYEGLLNQDFMAYGNYNHVDIIEYILNGRTPNYDISEYDKRLEFEKTRDAVNTAYMDYLNTEYKDEVEEAYNRIFNNLAPLKYDGAYLKLEGINPDIQLRSNQLAAVERAVYEDTVLLNHEVGTGKTFSLVASCMEKKRLKQVEKSLIITTNTVLNDFYQNAKKLYPKGKFLLIESSMLSPSNKQKTLAKIAFNDWDIVFMSHSAFGLIPISEKRQERLLQDAVDSLMLAVEDGDYNYNDEKILRRELKKRQYALDKFLANKVEITGLTFEDLNIDYLGVDESHNFKNLGISGEISSSQKSLDLYAKINYIYERSGKNKNVMFATGTPITNSVFEFYNIQKYLQPELLKEKGIDSVSRWSKQFLTERAEYEPNASATTWVLKYRYKFKNVPELIQMLKHTMDVATADEIGIEVPEEQRTTVVCEQSEIQRHEMALLDDRVKMILDKDNRIDPREDNLLKVVSDGTKLSLDPRLLNSDYPDFLGGKTSKCAEEVYKKYQESMDIKGTQLIFCDLGTPKTDSGYVYETLTNKLVEFGIPKEEIEWIHNHKNKDSLFRKMRNGDVRILIGSTQKMGEGMNVQDRCVAIHHIDVPWRPSDVEQREGRAVRFGNMNDKVDIFVYATEKSFDSFRWNTIDYKHSEVVPISRGTFDKREQQFDFDSASTFDPADLASITATDPRLKEKFLLEKQINEKSILLDIETEKRISLVSRIDTAEKRIITRDIDYNKVKDFEYDKGNNFYEILLFNKQTQENEWVKIEEYQKVVGRLQTIRKQLFKENPGENKIIFDKLKYMDVTIHVKMTKNGGLFYRIPVLREDFSSLRNIEHRLDNIDFLRKYYENHTAKDKQQIENSKKNKEDTEIKIAELKKELNILTEQRKELIYSIERDAAENGIVYNGADELNTEILETEMYSYKETHFKAKDKDEECEDEYSAVIEPR